MVPAHMLADQVAHTLQLLPQPSESPLLQSLGLASFTPLSLLRPMTSAGPLRPMGLS